MSKKMSKKQELLSFDNSLKEMVPLTDRGDSRNYGNLLNPEPPAGTTFVGFELNKIKRPKSIAEFIVLFTSFSPFMGNGTQKDLKAIEAKVLNNEKLTGSDTSKMLQGNETVNSVFRNNTTGELIKIPQCQSNRGRSFEDTYIIAKYFYKTLTWKQFINIVYRTVAVMQHNAAFSLYTQGGYACGAIRKNRVCYGASLQNKHYASENVYKELFQPITKEYIVDYLRTCSNKTGTINFEESLEGIYNQLAKNYMLNKERRRSLYNYNTKYDSKKSMKELAEEHINFNDHKLYVINVMDCLRKYLL